MPTVTKKPVETTGEPSMTEKLAEDAAAPSLEYLPGTPEFRPVLALPRAGRADYYAAMAQVSAAQQVAVDNGPPPSEGDSRPRKVTLSEAADMTRVLAAIEELLAVVAVDAVACRGWAMQVSDSDLAHTFNTYVRRTQPGEASSSAS